MNTEEAARELAKVFKESIIECLDDIIEQKCYLLIVETLKNINDKKLSGSML